MERTVFSTTLGCSLDESTRLRHELSDLLARLDHDLLLRHRIITCGAEAVNNIVEHGGNPAATIHARLSIDEISVSLEITDDSDGSEAVACEPVAATELCVDESGRGLTIMHSMSDRLAYSRLADTRQRLRMSWDHCDTRHRPRVLLIDDDVSMNRLHGCYLSDDYDVICAHDGAKALKMIAGQRFDLIISDIRMPMMDGLDLRSRITENRDDNSLTPFIFITSVDDENVIRNAHRMAIDDYLQKPVSKQDMLNTVGRVLNRNRLLKKTLHSSVSEQIRQALPMTLPTAPGGWQIGLAQRDTGSGGGDLMFHHHERDELTLSLIDIMGHDQDAKFFAHAYSGYMHGMMKGRGDTPSLAEQMRCLSEMAMKDDLLSRTMLTSQMMRLDDDRPCLEVVSAGHPAPLLVRDGELISIDVHGTVPGLIEDAQYDSERLELQRGDRFIMYTDGLFDGIEDRQQVAHLEREIRSAIKMTAALPVQSACDAVMTLFDALTDRSPCDDAMILMCEHAGSASR